MRALTFMCLAVLCLAAPATAQQSTPDDLNQFGLICFCSSRVATPHLPIKLDNNGKLLLAARNGATREALARAGIKANESQLRLLQDWGLLNEKDDSFKTAIVILDEAPMARLRSRLAVIKRPLLPMLRTEAMAIKAELSRRGFAESAYAVLFSYVLDGLVWRRLESEGKLPNTDITPEHPFWSGTFWAVYPKQDEMPGTNSRATGKHSLRMLWTPKVVDQINAFYGAERTGAWMDSFASDASLLPLFDDPNVSPLVIREDQDDPLYLRGDRIARIVADAMLSTDLSAVLPQADESQRLLIGTHELIWMLLPDIGPSQGINPPRVLASGANSSADLAPLVVAVIRREKP